MIWSAKAGHIISKCINSVQELKNTVRTAEIGDLLQLAKPGDAKQFDPVRSKLKSYAACATRTKSKSYFELSMSENGEADHIDKSGDAHVQRELSELHQQNDEDDGSKSGSSEDSDIDEMEDKKGVIYVRRSVDDDTESKSLEGQIADLTKVAREQDITLVCDPIVDEGETGTDFNRPGIQQVAALAEMGEISYLIVDDISRIGRSAPETLSFIAQLESDHEVTILTPTGGLDISQVEDLMQATMHSLIAHMSTQYRTRSSLRSKISNFVDDKDWKSWYRTVPIGYELSDDGWVEVCSEEVDVVDAMFDKFLETQSYAETARHLNTKYGETLGQNVTSHGVKDALQNSINLLPDSRTLEYKMEAGKTQEETFEMPVNGYYQGSASFSVGSTNTVDMDIVAPEVPLGDTWTGPQGIEYTVSDLGLTQSPEAEELEVGNDEQVAVVRFTVGSSHRVNG